MTDHEDLMKRCQRGATNLNDANNLLAECYGKLGKLGAENEALRKEVLELEAQRIYESWALHPEYVPWVKNGNSLKQDEARRLTRAAMSKEG
ncbi:hypothetical protein [Pseudomonas sp. SDO52101_S400]